MKKYEKTNSKKLTLGIIYLLFFLIWTILVSTIDRKPLGPNESIVGFATLNQAIHNLTGVHMNLYKLTDFLSIIPFAIIFIFGCVGIIQWVRRKSIRNVDTNILLLGTFYIVVLGLFFLFEVIPVNYRPVLINNVLEPSYPSSTTLLVLCTIPSTLLQCRIYRVKRCTYKIAKIVLTTYALFMVSSRMVAGVHWITDIIGGVLLSIGLITLLRGITYKSNYSEN